MNVDTLSVLFVGLGAFLVWLLTSEIIKNRLSSDSEAIARGLKQYSELAIARGLKQYSELAKKELREASAIEIRYDGLVLLVYTEEEYNNLKSMEEE